MANSIGGLARNLESFQRSLNRRVDETSRKAAHLGEQAQKREIIENDAVATGDLFRGAKGDYKKRGSVRIIELKNTAPHAGFVEQGTGQKAPDSPYKAPDYGQPLIEDLIEWATYKPLGPSQQGFSDPISKGFAAAHTIAGLTEQPSGTEPQPFFGPAYDATKVYLDNELAGDVKSAARKI